MSAIVQVPFCVVTWQVGGLALKLPEWVPPNPTVRLMPWVLVVYPELEARTVIDANPVAVDPFVTMVSVEPVELFDGGVTVGPGLKPVPAITYPLGKLRISSSTPLLNPFWLVTVTE